MDFSSMSGWDFERYCAECLLKKGFIKADVTSGSGDHGVDIIAEQSGIRFGIQCKLYQGSVPNKAVQEAFTGASYYDCDIAVILSNSELTPQAKEEARKLRVKFWNIADYMPEEDWTTDTHTPSPAKPKIATYDDYRRQRKEQEVQIALQIREKIEKSASESTTFETQADAYFRMASAYLVQESQFEYAGIIQSIEYFCNEMQSWNRIENQLLRKMSYIKQLHHAVCERLHSIDGLTKLYCSNIEKQLRLTSKNEMTLTQDEFNQSYWFICYEYEQFRQIVSVLPPIFEQFTLNDLAKLEELKISGLQPNHTSEDEVLDKLKDYLDDLLEVLHFLSYTEDGMQETWSFWKKDKTITNELQQHRLLIQDTRATFEHRTDLAREKYYSEKKKERKAESYKFALRKSFWEALKESLKVKQQKQEHLLQAQQEAQRRQKQERLLKEKQEADRLAREKAEQERKALIASLLIHYHAECVKIETEKQEELKRLAQALETEQAQAQKQIDELSNQKNAFILFRKKRGSELDAKIRILQEHIQALEQELLQKNAACEGDARKKLDALQQQILSEAENGGIKNRLEKEIYPQPIGDVSL